MALVQLSDIIVPTIFNDIPAVNSPEKTALFESGIVTQSPYFNSLAGMEGWLRELPFWNDLTATDAPNIATDATTDVASPKKVAQDEQIARKVILTQGWSTADLTAQINMGADPMTHIRSRVDRYWDRQWQRRLIATANGVLADNVANDSGDMVNDIAIEDGDNAVAANLFSRSAFTASAFTLGDMFNDIQAIAVHSVVMNRMVDNDDIDYIPDSLGRLTIPTFMGRRVIVDDSMPVVAGSTSGYKYTSILWGAGAFAYGEAGLPNGAEVEREAAQGNGMGVETLWTRKQWILHPAGFKVAATPAAAAGFTVAELAAAATWDRVVVRKNVPMAFLITNG